MARTTSSRRPSRRPSKTSNFRSGQRGETMRGSNGDAYAARAQSLGWRAIEIDGRSLDEIAHLGRGNARDRRPNADRRAHQGQGVFRDREQDRLARQGAATGHGRPRHQRAWRRAQPRRVGPEARTSSQRSVQRRSPSSCRSMTEARRWRHAQLMAMRSRRSARRAQTRRSGRRGEQLELRRTFANAFPDRFFASTSPRSDWSRLRWACRNVAMCHSQRPSRPSSRAHTTHRHGRRLAGERPPRRLARRRLDWRGGPSQWRWRTWR